jgi:glycosyltransferase involved in cell wall biosynthesis
MRILHVIGWINFADGGPPIVTTHLAAAQARLGHEVHVAYYSTSPEIDARTDAILAALPHWEKVKVHRLPPATRWEQPTGWAAGRLLRPVIENVDVIHLHNVWEGILHRVAAIARKLGKPYIIVINGMLHPWSLAQGALKKKIALALVFRRMLDGAAMLHVLNEDEREAIKPLGLKSPAIVIPNGVMLEAIEPLPPRGEFLARSDIKGRRYILFLARLHHKKGLDFLADAFAILAPRLADVDLVVAGPDGGEKENFQRRIAAAGISDRVHVVGVLYAREKWTALVDCDCFVLPSRQEGFSVAILEALAASRPVVISPECNFPEAAVAGEIVPLEAPKIAAALERVVTSPDRGRLGAAGRKLVEANYTWDHIAVRALAAYQTALSGK